MHTLAPFSVPLVVTTACMISYQLTLGFEAPHSWPWHPLASQSREATDSTQGCYHLVWAHCCPTTIQGISLNYLILPNNQRSSIEKFPNLGFGSWSTHPPRKNILKQEIWNFLPNNINPLTRNLVNHTRVSRTRKTKTWKYGGQDAIDCNLVYS